MLSTLGRGQSVQFSSASDTATRILDAVDAPAEPSGPTLEREHHPKRDGHAIYDECTEECHRSSMLSTPGPGQVTHSSSGSTVRVVPSTLFTTNARKNATDPRCCRRLGRAKWPTPRTRGPPEACRTRYLRRLPGRMPRILDAVDAQAGPSGPLLGREHGQDSPNDAIYDTLTTKSHGSSIVSTPKPAQVAQFSSVSTIDVVSDTAETSLGQKKQANPRYCRRPGRPRWPSSRA